MSCLQSRRVRGEERGGVEGRGREKKRGSVEKKRRNRGSE